MIDYLPILYYALWCWGAYALIMGSFVYTATINRTPITQSHVQLAFILSCFGVYSFCFALLRTMLFHKLAIPLSWNMHAGTIRE